MNFIKNIYYRFNKVRYKYLLYGSKVSIEKGAVFKVGKNVSIKNSNIYVKGGDILLIGDNVSISGASIHTIAGGKAEIKIGDYTKIESYNLSIRWGFLHIGVYNILEKGSNYKKPSIKVGGDLIIGDYNHMLCDINVQFCAKVKIGHRNAINEGTELRSDEKIVIGDYNQISYNCAIWDTNTHNIYKAEKRREITDSQYPDFGLEFEKPKTSPVIIGSDCWIGKNVSILKGTKLENKCIVALGTLLTNVNIAHNKTVFNNSVLKIVDNQI